MRPVSHSSLSTLPSPSVFFLFPDVSLQLPWLTANSFITGHKRQVLHLKGRHPPSPPAWVKNRPAGIAHRTRCSISTKWRPAGPKRWARNLSSRGTATEAEGTLLPRFFIVLLHSVWLWQKRRREIYPQIQGLMGEKTATQPVALNGHTPVLLFIQPRKSPNPYFV